MAKGRPASCPYCKSSQTRPKGYRKTVTLGTRPIRLCRKCGRRFTVKGKK